jgi:hypothetical protein
MLLYHVTNLSALIGDNAALVCQASGEEKADLSLAEPGSIFSSGLRPAKTDDYDHVLRAPLPPCVWLSSDPEMSGDFSTRQGVRLSVVIPSTDRRLVPWSKYSRKHGAVEVALGGREGRAAAQFWLYFGTITPARFQGLAPTAARA